MILDQPRVQAYFDERAERRQLVPNAREFSGWGSYQKYRQAVDLMSIPDVHMVLDMGCGIAYIEYLYSLQEVDDQEGLLFVAGIDISAISLRRAKSHGLSFADFGMANGCHLPFADEVFDLVICVEVVEHVTDQPEFLKGIHRVLRPGGHLYLTTPNGRCVSLLLQEKMYSILRILFGRPQPEKDDFLDSERLAQLLINAGLRGFNATDLYTLPRPFITFGGWSLTPPLPPTWGLAYQKFWNILLGDRGHRLPVWFRDRVYRTLSVYLVK